jgi:hypothetical protein
MSVLLRCPQILISANIELLSYMAYTEASINYFFLDANIFFLSDDTIRIRLEN